MTNRIAIALLTSLLLSQTCSTAYASPAVSIVSDQDSVNTHMLPMMDEFVYVKIESNVPLGRVTLRLEYDAYAITFLGAEAINQLNEWEYFTWNHSPRTDCGDSCQGDLELLAVADLNDADSITPTLGALTLAGHAIRLRFRSSCDLNLLNACAKIGFRSESCGDVVLESASGDTFFVRSEWPGVCAEFPDATIQAEVIANNGRVCVFDPDGNGDINLDARINEVGDFVLFNRFMIYGVDALDPVWQEAQLIGLDTNDDGQIGTVGDLRHLLRLIAAGTRFPQGGFYR